MDQAVQMEETAIDQQNTELGSGISAETRKVKQKTRKRVDAQQKALGKIAVNGKDLADEVIDGASSDTKKAEEQGSSIVATLGDNIKAEGASLEGEVRPLPSVTATSIPFYPFLILLHQYCDRI